MCRKPPHRWFSAHSTGAFGIDKTIWFAGFKPSLERAILHTVDNSRILDVSATLENQGDETTPIDRTIAVSSNGRSHELGYSSDLPNVPGRATGKGTFSFPVGDQEFSLGDAVITFGKSDKNQATVPLG